ncbi:helix-turn-helix domain-containing protein [Patescibacteria group bacterium]|nr:helix-turn-helix domain-containing protein [Patescibacteria group bacterium]MBU0879895.1 helix-turn-helix domain-containing protein [Patescibacteria group bacterium]MBU0880362.1 helix-turn-helix domain-containing protein [Patescibacteria group bacterium]MBU0898107.1 helix-turn-helix domain-containing protein [Patescibacteria group bacterium]MBU1062600.1 helix-turn-helix domain-containing protein [Patescibacteria group bacterium]
MIPFVSNKLFLDSETVAEQLRRARQEKKIKLEQVAKKLNINYKYLNALEKGDYDKLPKGVYGKNFLKEYSNFLGLDYPELVATYELEVNVYQPREEKEVFSRQLAKKQYFWSMPKVIKNFLIIIVIVICFVYLGVRLNKIIVAPDLLVLSPADNFITQQSIVEVRGKTEVEVEVTINNEIILSDVYGNFSKMINLKNGLNIITIKASKKYSKSKIIVKQVLVKEK